MPGALPPPLHLLAQDPAATAIFADFDGTLAPIVADPAAARPLPGADRVLARVARRFGLVAVVSGRPAAFLAEALPGAAGVRLVGLYGLETVGENRSVQVTAEAEGWRPVVAEVIARARDAAPVGLGVESKGLTVALHWRRHPEAEGWARAFAQSEAERTGLDIQQARMAVELRPAIETDKGTVVRHLAAGATAVGYFGDDLGDLPAFAVLEELAEAGVRVARVAVADAESPADLALAADVVVDGPRAVLDLLSSLAGIPPAER